MDMYTRNGTRASTQNLRFNMFSFKAHNHEHFVISDIYCVFVYLYIYDLSVRRL